MTTEQIIVRRQEKEFFENACDSMSLIPKVLDDTSLLEIVYEITVDYPMQLYYLGRSFQLQISQHNTLEILKESFQK